MTTQEISYPTRNMTILLKGDDVARVLNVSRALAYRLMQTGEIPTVRLGRAVRVRPQDLEQFIQGRMTSSAP